MSMFDLDYNDLIKKHPIPEKAKFYRVYIHNKGLYEIHFYDEQEKDLNPHPYLG